jgi:FKBP-type peptidyl-prolyl cis-trans isomerase FkpA
MIRSGRNRKKEQETIQKAFGFSGSLFAFILARMSSLLKFLPLLFLLVACSPEDAGSPWKKRPEGYFYRLLAFENMERTGVNDDFAHLDLVFATLKDSVFWDSRSNFNNAFYLQLHPSKNDMLRKELAMASEADSFCLLIKTERFFIERFGTKEIPVFCRQDSSVKIYCRVKEFFGKEEMKSLSPSLEENEKQIIAAFFGNELKQKNASDRSGIFWIEKPQTPGRPFHKGDRITVSYRGYFLNGRLMDEGDPEFRMSYGDPSQLIPGLNNVMAVLKEGQNAKIIIPSRLAFGSNGSSTGIVPPYTPLLYEISVNRE